jgi:hypothetical protein
VNSPPFATGVGEHFLSDIVKGYPIGKLFRYSTISKRRICSFGEWCGFPYILKEIRSSSLPVFSTYYEIKARIALNKKVVDEIKEVIARENIDVVWSVLSSSATINITYKLINEINKPIVSTILDDPEYFTSNQNFDPIFKAIIMKEFEVVLKNSFSVSVVSPTASIYYREKYSIDTTIIKHGIDEILWKKPLLKQNNDHVRVVFAGSLYSKKEWNAFLRAIEYYNSENNGKKISVTFIGRFPRTGANKSNCLILLGPKSLSETMELLCNYDVAYLPYWFDPKKTNIVKTSFPGKMSAYAAAGVPIFFHGPEYSSSAEFLKIYPIGVSCCSLGKEDILRSLTSLTDQKFLCSLRFNQELALKQSLGLSVNIDNFKKLIIDAWKNNR